MESFWKSGDNEGCLTVCDCHLTLTTSSGVTAYIVSEEPLEDYFEYSIPNRPVNRLPVVAESIFWNAVISSGSFVPAMSPSVGSILGRLRESSCANLSWF